MYWKDMRHMIQKHTKLCARCQLGKKHKRKYGHLPAKLATIIPWNQVCVDLVGIFALETLLAPLLKDGEVSIKILHVAFLPLIGANMIALAISSFVIPPTAQTFVGARLPLKLFQLSIIFNSALAH